MVLQRHEYMKEQYLFSFQVYKGWEFVLLSLMKT